MRCVRTPIQVQPTGYGTSLQYFANQIDPPALKFEHSYKYIRSLCVLSVVDVTAYRRAQLLKINYDFNA